MSKKSRFAKGQAPGDGSEAPTSSPDSGSDSPPGQNAAWRLNERGNELRERFLRSGDQDLLKGAIELFGMATREAVAEDPARAGYWYNFGNGLKDRFYWSTKDGEDLARAIDAYEKALSLAPPDFPELGLLLNGLGVAYFQSYLLGSRPEGLREAIPLFEDAVQAVPQEDREEKATILTNLGVALETWYQPASTSVSDLEKARQVHQQAVATAPPKGEAHLSALNNHGNTLRLLFLRRRNLPDLEEAIGQFEKSVAGTRPDSPKLASRLNNLGNALRDRAQFLEGHRLDVDRALAAHAKAIELTQRGTQERSPVLTNLGNALVLRFEYFEEPSDLEAAIGAYRQTLEETLPSAPNRPGYLQNLAKALSLRWRLTSSPSDFEEGNALFEEALKLGKQLQPEAALISGRSWGEWAIRWRRWEKASQAFGGCLEVIETILHSQDGREDGEDWLREVQGIAGRAAYAMAKSDRLLEAVSILERGLGRLLRERLGAGLGMDSETGISGLEGIFPAEVLETPRWVYLISIEDGGLALIVEPAQASPVQALWLPDLREDVLSERIQEIMVATGFPPEEAPIGTTPEQHRARSEWFWDTMIPWLWPTAAEALLGALDPGKATALIPTGLLSLFPWHAVPTPDGKRHVLDSHCFSYAPYALSLGLSEERRALLSESPRLVAVGNPRPTSQPDLPLAALEVELIAPLFAVDHYRLFLEAEATKEHVLAYWGSASYLHLSCHAAFELEASSSYILLADDEHLTLQEIRELKLLESVRLVTLSACDSATREIGLLPDEALGLFAGLLEAGAPGVIGALGEANEEASALLMWRFYDSFMNKEGSEQLPPAKALRRSQVWLRDATAADLVRMLDGLDRRRFSAGSLELIDRVLSGFLLQSPGAHPFSAPRYWAPFVFVGV